MSFTVEPYPAAPIIITNLHRDFEVTRELPFVDQATLELLEAATTPQTLIIIFHGALNIDEMLEGARVVAHDGDPIWHHAKVKQVLWVTDDETLKAAAKGLATEDFGNLQVAVFETFDHALAVALGG